MNNDLIEDLVDYARELLAEGVEEVVVKVSEEMKSLMKQLVHSFKDSKSVTFKKVDNLSLSFLLQIAQDHIAIGANGFAALKLQKKKSFFVYLANCKDQELLDEQKNKYVIIQAKRLDSEVEQLFSKNDLIILQ